MVNRGTSYDDPGHFRGLEAVLAGVSGDLGPAVACSKPQETTSNDFNCLCNLTSAIKLSSLG